MHLFHKWETIHREEGTAQFAFIFNLNNSEKVILTLQKCSKCPKERAFLETLSGKKYSVNPDFFIV